MGLKDSLIRLKKDEKISVKREVKKELTKIKNDLKVSKYCVICGEKAQYFIKGSSKGYCRDCAKEYFGTLGHLERV
jgi:hypothetical protein